MSNSFSTFELKTPTSLLGISEQGGYVTDWQVKDKSGNWKPILYVGTELKRTGIPILFPYYGPSKPGLGQHGFGRNLKWKVVQQSESACALQLTDADLDPATKLLYPHQFQTQIRLKLSDNSFEYILHVQNRGSTPMPIAPGLHPYWTIPHQQKVNVRLEKYPEFNVAEIDWDHNPPDTEYDFKNPVTITLPDEQNPTPFKSITIEDLSGQITKLVVWSQPLVSPDHDFICFEPVTLERGSYDKLPLMVKPDEIWQLHLKFTVKP